jgi:hypothetical protein
MILLLDENIPSKLRHRFHRIEVRTVLEMGWAGYANGHLMQTMMEAKLDALLTFDKKLQHQQNFKRYPIPVLVLHGLDNRYESIVAMVPGIENLLLRGLKPGPTPYPS